MLYLVPTPIGNLKDITLRALETLKNVDVIACEDTRHTQKLLTHYEIKKPLISYHEHSKNIRLDELVRMLCEGKKVALVSDGGMPLISDPGFPLVREAIRKDIKVECLPGASAGVTALAASGLATHRFSFLGFLPPKSAARKRELSSVADRPDTLIVYESPFRVVKCLENMKEVLGDREAVVAREITKKFEEIARGYLSNCIDKFSKSKVLGEVVILVAGKDQKEGLHV